MDPNRADVYVVDKAQPLTSFLSRLPDRDHRIVRSTRTTLETSIVEKTSIAIPDITGDASVAAAKVERKVDCDKCGEHFSSSEPPTSLSTRLVTRGVDCDKSGKQSTPALSTSVSKSLVTRNMATATVTVDDPQETYYPPEDSKGSSEDLNEYEEEESIDE
jgi:hypothetical protein